MKLYENLIEIKLKSKTLILVISLLSDVSHVLSAQKLNLLPLSSCDSFARGQSCHYPSTRCNKDLHLCECKPKFPIPLISINQCLDLRNLGQECVLSEQCQIPNSICISSDGKQIVRTDKKAVDQYFAHFKRNDHFLNKQNKSIPGQCKCKRGYNQNGRQQCYRISLNNLTCLGAYECLETVK